MNRCKFCIVSSSDSFCSLTNGYNSYMCLECNGFKLDKEKSA